MNNVSHDTVECVIDGCDHARYRTGLCVTHYQHKQKYGDPLAGKFKREYRLDKPEGCDIEGCRRPHHANGLCVPHWQRRQAYGDPLAGPPLRKQRNSSSGISPNTKSAAFSDDYHTNHRAIRKAKGPAWQHKCDYCSSQAESWATKHEHDGTEIDHYTPLCWSCHVRYDNLARNLPDNTGSKRSSESREKMRQAAIRREAAKRDARTQLRRSEGGDG